MKRINENQKVTLTFGQLKRLIKEAGRGKKKLDYSIKLNVALDLMFDRQVEEWDSECEKENVRSDFDKLCVALDILTDSQYDEYIRIIEDR